MTSLHLRVSRELCLGFLLLLLAACSNAAGDDDDAAGGSGGTLAGSGGASGTGTGTGGTTSTNTGTPAFRVNVTAANGGATLCAGACTSLTATADHGVAPYTYSFDHDIGDGAGPHKVCPAETTTYQVTVRDSSVDDDEFHEKNADVVQSITLEVAASCDGGVEAGDAGGDTDGATGSGKPGTPGKPLCSERIATVHDTTDANSLIDIWWNDFSPKLAVDADDNVVMALTYQGTLDLADGTSVTSKDHYGVLIAKYDADCKPLWFKNHTGDHGITEGLLAVDSKGHVIVAARTLDGDAFDQALLLSAFDADGDPLWEKSVDGAPGLHWQTALRVDANDDIVWLVAATSGTDFGGGALGAGNGIDPTMEVLVKFDSAGNYVWSELIQDGNGQDNGTNAAMAIVNGTDIVFAGASINPQDWGAGGQTQGSQPGQPHSYLVRANAAGEFVASETTNSDLPTLYALPWIEVDRDDDLVLARVGAVDLVVRTGAGTGMDAWTQPTIITGTGFAGDWNKLSVDADRHIVLGGSFRTSTVVNDVARTAPDGSMDAYVQRLSADGDVLWTYSTEDALGSEEWLLGMATDSTGSIATAIGTLTDTARELYLVKLAP